MVKSKSSSRGKRKPKQSEPTPQESVAAAFLSCARCSFFLVGYRLLHNDFDEAVQRREDGRLTLTWDHAVKQLIQKSYGVQIEADAFHYQGSCKACQRAFIFQEGQGDDQPPTLQIAIKNRP
jgi:hypothetical protein